MVSIKTFTEIAAGFPEVSVQPHFEKTSFRVNKKIFATLDTKQHQACIKLSAADQDIFSAFDKSIIYPVPNKWGKQGWTFVDLKKIRKIMLIDALKTAYCEIAPAKLAAVLKAKESNRNGRPYSSDERGDNGR